MRKDGTKPPKGGKTKKAAVKDLTAKDAKAVKGGQGIRVTKLIDKSSTTLT